MPAIDEHKDDINDVKQSLVLLIVKAEYEWETKEIGHGEYYWRMLRHALGCVNKLTGTDVWFSHWEDLDLEDEQLQRIENMDAEEEIQQVETRLERLTEEFRPPDADEPDEESSVYQKLSTARGNVETARSKL